MKKRISPFLILCLMGGLAIFSSTMAKNPALPLFTRSLGVPVNTVGFIAAASTVVGILVSLPAGILSDIIGRRRVLLIAAIIFATAPFAYLLVTGAWVLVAVRIYHGLATAILGPVAMAAVADTFDKGRGERMAWYSSATMIGRFLAPLAGGALIFGDNFRWVYLVDGFVGVLALVAALRLPLSTTTSGAAREALRYKRGEFSKEIGTILTHRGILATSVVEAVQYFAFGCIETFLPIYLNEQLGFSPLAIGFLFTTQIFIAAFTKPIMGRLSDRYGRIPLIIAGLALGGATTAAMTHSTNYVVLLVLIGLFGLGLATVTASTAAIVADFSRASSRGSALGVLSTIMDIGQSSGPMVSGVLIGAYRYNAAFGIVGVGLILTSLAFGLVMRQFSKAS